MAKQHSNGSRKPSKVRPVLISRMRVPPALVAQRSFSQPHADKIAAALDLNKLGYPIINHRDGIDWVLDGQHRIEALKARGFENDLLDCEVYEDLTDAEAAEIFLGRDARRAIGQFDKFHVACTAGRKRENDIRRAIEAQGLKVSRNKSEGCIGAVNACGKVYDRSGDVVLGQAIRTLKQAFNSDPSAFDGTLIEGAGLVFNRYNGQTDEKDLARKLAAVPYGVHGILRRAEAQRERTGNQKSQCIAAVLVDIYNRGLHSRTSRLPSWWKGPVDEKTEMKPPTHPTKKAL